MPADRHHIVAAPEFVARLEQLQTAWEGGDERAGRILTQAARLVRELGDGTDNGHHPLTDKSEVGQGDLRDCTASEFRSDPQAKLDCRLVWRQLAEQEPGQGPVRELIHVGLRHETPDTYEHSIATLERDPSESLAENDVFGKNDYVGQKNTATRNAALENQRTVALARAGVAPMSKSRPLGEADFGARTSSGATATRTRTLSDNKNGRGT